MQTGGLEWKRLVVLYNPASTCADRTQKIIARLEKLFPGKVAVLQTKKTTAERTRQLNKRLQAGDLVLVGGGDGTINQTICCLGKHIALPLLPLPGGNANDLAEMLYGAKAPDVPYILEHGRTKEIYPLKCLIEPEGAGSAATHLAACYVSFGSTALAAAYINQASLRSRYNPHLPGSNFLRGIDVFIHTWRRAQPFSLEYHHNRRTVLDIVIGNGSRMARNWRFPSRIAQQDMFVTFFTDKKPLRVAKNIVQLLRGTFPGEHIRDGEVIFRILSPSRGQADGEPFAVTTPCTVRVSHAPQPVRIVSL